MLTQTHLLLIDIQLLQIEHHLLLKTLRIIFHPQIIQTLLQPLAHSLDTLRLIRLHLILQLKNKSHTRSHVLVKRLPLAATVSHDGIQSLIDSILHKRPVKLSNHVALRRIHHVGHTQQSRQQIIRLVQRQIGGTYFAPERLELTVVVQSQFTVNQAGGGAGIGLPGQKHVDSPPLQPVGKDLPHLNILLLWKKGTLDADFRILTVD